MPNINELLHGEDTPYTRLVIAAGQALSDNPVSVGQIAQAIEPLLNKIIDERIKAANLCEPTSTPSAEMIKAGVDELELRIGSRHLETSHFIVKAIYEAMTKELQC